MNTVLKSTLAFTIGVIITLFILDSLGIKNKVSESTTTTQQAQDYGFYKGQLEALKGNIYFYKDTTGKTRWHLHPWKDGRLLTDIYTIESMDK